MALPLADLRGPVRALFSDVDGTLTTGGRVESSTYATLERLGEAGVAVVLVSGRPAGWGQAFISVAPVAAVVTENGGVTWLRDGRKLSKLYGVPAASVPEWRRRMLEAVAEVSSKVPGARLSSDQQVPRGRPGHRLERGGVAVEAAADEVVALLRRHGFTASRSSVHATSGRRTSTSCRPASPWSDRSCRSA